MKSLSLKFQNPFKKPSAPGQVKQEQTAFRVSAQPTSRSSREQGVDWKGIHDGLAAFDSPDDYAAAHDQYFQQSDTERFAHMPPSTQARLMEELMKHGDVSFMAVEAFQALVSKDGGSFDIDAAMEFAQAWDKAKANGSDVVSKFGFGPKIDECVNALLTLKYRAHFYASDKVDFKKGETIDPKGDLAAQEGAILNAASRKGLGKSGASLSLQRAFGKKFTEPQKTLYAKHTNLVGNAPVGEEAYVVPIDEDKAVVSVAGPNHKHHTGLGFKVPRLSHWLNPNKVSQSQEEKLRTSYETYFKGVETTGFDEAPMVPISGNVFGIPAPECAQIAVESIVRNAVMNPERQYKMFTVNAAGLTKEFKDRFDKIGVGTTHLEAVPAAAAAA